MTNIQKTPLSRSVNTLIQRKAAAEFHKRWLVLPGSVLAVNGGIVTINFNVPGLILPNTDMPVNMSKYCRQPIQVGDLGIARPASAYVDQVSGLGTGSPSPATLQPNLSGLVWEPVSNKAWASVGEDQVLTDATGASVLTLSPTGITLAFGGHEVTITSAGVTIDSRVFLNHEHTAGTYTNSGGAVTGDSGAVV